MDEVAWGWFKKLVCRLFFGWLGVTDLTIKTLKLGVYA